MNVKTAAANLQTLVVRHLAEHEPHIEPVGLAKRNNEGRGIEHALWMLEELIAGHVEDEKAHRWLGDAAGMLRQMRVVTLDGCKYANLFA